MKKLKMLLALCLALAMLFALAACGSSSSSDASSSSSSAASSENTDSDNNDAEQTDSQEEDSTSNEGAEYNIAIVKQMDHASLDEIADAICAELDAIAAENNITINYQVYSGQSDESVLTQIGEQVIAEGVDAIIPIATLAAQVMANCAEETQTPVIFAAISDPGEADLLGIDYVTGTSDALDTTFILDMMTAVNADVSEVGLLYSKSEANSTTAIAEAKEYLEANNIDYVEATANTNDEVLQAVSTLIADGVDAIFTPTDNIIMNAELAIYEELIDAGIPHYTGADSFVRNGAFATCGVNYTDLGTDTADLAYHAITQGMSDLEDYYVISGGIITVNTETAAALDIDYSVYADMGELVEVVTSED